MRRLIDFYRLQIHVMRTWRPSTGSRLRRILATMIVSVLSFGIAVYLTPGVDLTPGAGIFSTALLAAIVLGILNVAIRPVLIAAFAAVSVIAVTVATLVFQVVSFLILPRFVDTLAVSGWFAALVASLIYAMSTTVFVAIFSISSDDSYFAILVQQLSARGQDVHRTDAPGLVVVQIDGLARQILTRQIQAGRAPHLSGWVRSGRYSLDGWEALLPPTTPASQAGLLHGNNDGIPAFRWYEKDAGRLMVTNHPDDAVVVESRISNGEGLLSNDGASVGNLFSGDAARSYITMATIKDKSQGLGKSTSFYSFFASPTNYLGTLTRFGAEVVKEYYQASRQVRATSSPGCIAGCRIRSRGPPRTWRFGTCRPPSWWRRCIAGRRSSTSTTPTTTRSPTTAGPSEASRWTRWTGSTAPSRPSRRPPAPRRAPTASSSCPTMARRSGPRSCSATGRPSATSSKV